MWYPLLKVIFGLRTTKPEPLLKLWFYHICPFPGSMKTSERRWLFYLIKPIDFLLETESSHMQCVLLYKEAKIRIIIIIRRPKHIMRLKPEHHLENIDDKNLAMSSNLFNQNSTRLAVHFNFQREFVDTSQRHAKSFNFYHSFLALFWKLTRGRGYANLA